MEDYDVRPEDRRCQSYNFNGIRLDVDLTGFAVGGMSVDIMTLSRFRHWNICREAPLHSKSDICNGELVSDWESSPVANA
jgi:hypothetical protein